MRSCEQGGPGAGKDASGAVLPVMIRDPLADLPDPAFVIDALGCIDDVNDSAAVLVGRTRAELLGQSIDLAISSLGLPAPGADGAMLDHTLFVPLGHGARACHHNGASVPVEVLLCPHGPRAVLAIVLHSREGLVEDDVAQIVHDLKGPLSTIALEAELLDSADPVMRRNVVSRMMLNIGFLDRLVRDLLDLCALDTGRFALQRSRTELRELVEHVIERCIPTRDRHRVHVDIAASATVEVDDIRIERVIANLLQNALKFSKAPAELIVRVEVHAHDARVSVIDAGPGIAATEHRTIFERFRRGRARTRDSSGLGLYVSKRIVEAHGGSIGVESEPGTGSQFYFELPLD